MIIKYNPTATLKNFGNANTKMPTSIVRSEAIFKIIETTILSDIFKVFNNYCNKMTWNFSKNLFCWGVVHLG